MKVVPRELNVSALRPLVEKDEGLFYLPFIPAKTRNGPKTADEKALKGRVAVPGCIQRAGECWEARMPTNRE